MARSLRSWMLVFCGMFLGAPFGFGAIPSTERVALVAIYSALDGPNWGDHTNWLGPAGSECSWVYVTCDTAGSTVIQLDVSWNKARGVLPKEIGDLTNLEVFNANGSSLTGPLPPEVGRLSKLKRLNLDGFYDNLGLDGNEISGPIPREIGQLTNLQYLNLEGNQISGTLPDELGSLLSLEELNLTYNPLMQGSIPPSLFRLPKLRWLSLSADSLTRIDPAGRIAGTRISVARQQQAHWIDSGSIGQSVRLTELDLGSNQLTGTIPPELGQLTQLTRLYIGRNPLEGNLPSLANLKKLTVLGVDSSRISGPLPSWTGQLQALETLYVGETGLSGELPAEFYTLPKLKLFYAAGTRLSGKLLDFARIASLEDLDLSRTDVTGPFPVELTRLENLRVLKLNELKLGEALPPETGLLKNLEDLELANTQISAVPDEIRELTKLSGLNLGRNFLKKLPPIEKMSSLVYLSVGSI